MVLSALSLHTLDQFSDPFFIIVSALIQFFINSSSFQKLCEPSLVFALLIFLFFDAFLSH